MEWGWGQRGRQDYINFRCKPIIWSLQSLANRWVKSTHVPSGKASHLFILPRYKTNLFKGDLAGDKVLEWKHSRGTHDWHLIGFSFWRGRIQTSNICEQELRRAASGREEVEDGNKYKGTQRLRSKYLFWLGKLFEFCKCWRKVLQCLLLYLR